MTTLLITGSCPYFLIEFPEQDYEASVKFKVFEVTSWIEDEAEDKRVYLEGIIKWDGCSHITFGEDGSGYIHLCGKFYWDLHNKVMTAIWDLCTKKIKNFDYEQNQ